MIVYLLYQCNFEGYPAILDSIYSTREGAEAARKLGKQRFPRTEFIIREMEVLT